MIIPVWVLSVAEASLGGDVSKKDTSVLGIDEKNKEGEEGGEGVRREVCVDLVLHRMCQYCFCMSMSTLLLLFCIPTHVHHTYDL